MQQHHAGQPSGYAVENPDVNGVKAVDDTALAHGTYGRGDLVRDRRHPGLENGAGHLRRAAAEMIDIALRAAAHVDRGDVGTEQRFVVRVFVMPMAGYLGSNDTIDFLISAVVGECRIAAQHAAAMHVHHAAADRIVDLKPDLVEPLEQPPTPPSIPAM